MTESQGSRILLTGVETGACHRVASALRADGRFETHIREWSPEMTDQLAGEHFSAIVIWLPIPGAGLGVLLSAIRSKMARCRESGVVIIAPDDEVDAVARLEGRGVNRVVSVEDPVSAVVEAVASVLGVAKRVTVRIPVQLELTLPAGECLAFCQTENLSETGMLIKGFQHYPAGTRFGFEMFIPGTDRRLKGVAEVARSTDSGRETVEGFGARFVDVDDTDRTLLLEMLNDTTDVTN